MLLLAALFTVPPGAPAAGFEQVRLATPAGGKFLVADRSIRDPRFRKTVILLLNHDEEGSVGLIVNRPAGIPLTEFFPETPPGKHAGSIYMGGPVRPTLFSMLVRSEGGGDERSYVLDDVYLIFGTDAVTDAVADLDESATARIYAGYTGWAPGQLAAELREGGWHLADGDPDLVFSGEDGQDIWDYLIERVSGRWI